MVGRGFLQVIGAIFLLVAIPVFAKVPGPLTRAKLQPSLTKFQLKHTAFDEAIERMSVFTYSNNMMAGGEYQDFSTARKSRLRAFFQSFLLPGWGQHYAGSRTMMRAFIASEAVLWASFIGFTAWGNWLESDFRTLASEHAGVEVSGKPGKYFVDISNFRSIEEFNQAQLRNRDVSALYRGDTFFWQWDSEANRLKYADIRRRSVRADNRAELTLGAIFVNHLVSAIHSTLAVFKFNRDLEARGIGLNIDFKQDSLQQYKLALRLSKQF